MNRNEYRSLKTLDKLLTWINKTKNCNKKKRYSKYYKTRSLYPLNWFISCSAIDYSTIKIGKDYIQ